MARARQGRPFTGLSYGSRAGPKEEEPLKAGRVRQHRPYERAAPAAARVRVSWRASSWSYLRALVLSPCQVISEDRLPFSVVSPVRLAPGAGFCPPPTCRIAHS